MNKTSSKLFLVSVIVPTLNTETTVTKTLESIVKQKYPILEIIVVDNASRDSTVACVKKFAKSFKRFPIRIIQHSKNLGVATSYNKGVSIAKSSYVIFMHSDSVLVDSHQFTLLTEPLRKDKDIIATCALTTVPISVWTEYPFWEKCLLVQSVGKYAVGLNGKCDCHKKAAFLKIGGFDEKNYARDENIGGEDGDLALRLQKIGKVIASKAKVIHLHSLNKNYSLFDFVKNRKLLARSYGRFLKFHPDDYRLGTIGLVAKPFAVLFSVFVPQPWNMVFLVLFANVFYRKIYMTKAAWKHKEIFLLPFVTLFLVFYEAYWTIDGFLYLKRKNV